MTVQKVPLSTGDRSRPLTGEASLLLRNRYIEENIALSDGDPCFIARPALKYFDECESGPIRAIYQPPGGFDDSIFVASGDKLCQIVPTSGAASVVNTGIDNTYPFLPVKFATTGAIGDIPPILYYTDRANLWAYTDEAPGRSVFIDGSIANGDTIELDGVYYEWTTGSVDTGSPAGTVGDPWLVAYGSGQTTALRNMFDAINASGTEGTDYSTGVPAHSTLRADYVNGSDTLEVISRVFGGGGNGISTTTIVGGGTWNAAGADETINGGSPGNFQIAVPFGVECIALTQINNYLILIPKQFDIPFTDENVSGRFYWIEPGEMWIDPLNFSTAERQSDNLLDCTVFNDELWLLGTETTEIWYATGDQDAPFTRLKGALFDRGTISGSVTQINESVVVIDEHFSVLQISGRVTKLSPPDIEERIRRNIKDTQSGTFGLEEAPVVGSWTFSLDGHDYYVLQLNSETLLYDFSVERWYTWGSGTSTLWNAQVGLNWRADLTFIQETTMGVSPNTALSNVIVGDRTNGALYFLHPQEGLDDNNTDTGTATYTRYVYGQVIHRGRDFIPCSAIEVTGSVGFSPASGQTSVTLEYSDDRGNSFTSAGAVTVAAGTYTTRLDWRSLGHMKEPGRIFRISDTGALVRIDGMDMHVDGT